MEAEGFGLPPAPSRDPTLTETIMNKADYAIATMSGLTSTPEEMVTTGSAAISGIKGSPSLAGAPDVQTALDLFITKNDSLDANNQKKEDLRQKLAQVEADEVTLVRRWGLRRQGVLHAVTVQCDGSKEKVQAFNLGVVQRNKVPPATVPANLRQGKSPKPTTPVVVWDRVVGRDGYLLQHATSINDPTTYVGPIMCKRARFALPGQTLAATLYFRVLSLDPALPGGQTEYTAWVAVTVGAT
jgi:hypothetical protein